MAGGSRRRADRGVPHPDGRGRCARSTTQARRRRRRPAAGRRRVRRRPRRRHRAPSPAAARRRRRAARSRPPSGRDRVQQERARPRRSCGRRALVAAARRRVDAVLGGRRAAARSRGSTSPVDVEAKRGLFKKADAGPAARAVRPRGGRRRRSKACWTRVDEGASAGRRCLCLLLLGHRRWRRRRTWRPRSPNSGARPATRRPCRSMPVDVRDWDALFPPDAPAVVAGSLQSHAAARHRRPALESEPPVRVQS